MGDGADIEVVRVLGSVEILLGDGRVVVPPSLTQRRVLAVLAASAGRSVPAAQLGDLVELSTNAVRVAVGRLRRLALGPWLSTTAAGYRLDAATDASLMCAELERAGEDPSALERAIAWWGGAPFGEFGQEAWAAGHAAHLVERYAGAVEDRAELLLERGAGSEAVALLEGLVAAHPWRDRSWGLLIRALASCGRRVEALRAYQRHRQRLVVETGTEPSAELRRIEQRVVAGWDGRSSPAGSLEQLSELPPRSRRGTAEASIIGRRGELAELLGSVPAAPHAGTTACIVGEAGIGKTLLLETFVARAVSAGVLVVQARCDEAAGTVLQPFRVVIDQLWGAAPPKVVAGHLQRHGDRLAAVVPQLVGQRDAGPPITADNATARFLLFEAVVDLLASVARHRPVVVAIDDVHFADSTSLALLRHLARALAELPVLVVVATREPRADADTDLRAMLTDLTRAGGRRIELAPFDDQELRQLVELSLSDGVVQVDDDLIDVLTADTCGNPLLATHLVRHWIDEGTLRIDQGTATLTGDRGAMSPVLRDLVWARLRSLDPAAPAVLAAAAVLDDPIVERALADTAGLGQPDVDRVLDLVTGASILTEVTEPTRALRFAHGLIARAVVQDLPASKRRRLHERAAHTLVRLRDLEPAASAARIAHQFAEAHLPAQALHWSLRAGDETAAMPAGAAEAVAWYREALEHANALRADDGVRADVLVRLGEVEQRAGIAGALDRLVEAGELARTSGRDDCLVRAALATDRGFVRVGEFAPTQLELVEAALATVPPTEIDTRARLLALLGECLVGSTDVGRREAVALEALAAADASTDPTVIGRIAPAILYALWTPRTAGLRREIGERGVASAMRTRDPHLQFVALAARHNTQVALGDAIGARRSLQTMRDLVAAHPEPRMRWGLGATETYQATMAADFISAERLVEENYALGAGIGESDAFSMYASQLYVLRTFEGRHAEMLPLIEQIGEAGGTPLPFRLAFGIACAAVGRNDTAAAMLTRGFDDGFESVPQNLLWLTSIVGYAVLAIELGDIDAASALHPLLAPYADQVAFNGITSQGPVAAYVGKLASMLGRHDEADHHLRAALRTAESFGWEYHRATTLFALAESRARRDGRLDREASDQLATAAAICAKHGITGWAARIAAGPSYLVP